MKSKILFIICYFGKLPWYTNFFLKSANYNPSINFLWVSDCSESIELPDNFQFVKMNLTQLKSMAESKLSIEIGLGFSYKICDIRPAYGIIFDDYIKDYDFWGYCDIDVIFGDIRKFMSERLLKKYDVISARPEFLSGYFSLFRNSPETNTLFKVSKDYEQTFTSIEYKNFDECGYRHKELLYHNMNVGELEDKYECMTYVLKKKCKNNGIKVFFDLIALEFNPGNIAWKEGKIIYADKIEALLYHLIQFKKDPKSVIPDWETIPDSYKIEAYEFFK